MASNRGLHIEISNYDPSLSGSYKINNDQFQKDGCVIDSGGVSYKGTRHNGITREDVEIKEKIGSGSSGFVNKFVDKRTNEIIAIKYVNCEEKLRRNQIVKEISLFINHDCVALVKFLGCFYLDGFVCIGLEYMDLGSLDNYGGNGKTLTEFVTANITYEILWALGYLEYEKLVHRDIKPQNILLNHLGEVKLSDFGISKVLSDSSGDMCHTFVGTFKYMSPERIDAKPYGYASDIWSLGIVLYECLMGTTPYQDCNTVVDVIFSIKESPIPELSDRFSPEVRELIHSCLKKEPKERESARKLIGCEWLISNNAIDYEYAKSNVYNWLQKIRN